LLQSISFYDCGLIQPLVDHVMFSVYCSVSCNKVTWNVEAREGLLTIFKLYI